MNIFVLMAHDNNSWDHLVVIAVMVLALASMIFARIQISREKHKERRGGNPD